MKVLGINGSHRGKSNSSIMIEKALEVCQRAGHDVSQIDLAAKDMRYCTVCDQCKEKLTCPLEDDIWDMLEQMQKADAIIVASPVYFGGVTARLRCLFDRTLPLRRNTFLLSGKIGAALSTGGSRNGGQEYTLAQIHHWMMIQEMIIVGDKKTGHFGGICSSHKPGSVLEDEFGLDTVVNTAVNVCDTLKRL